MENLSSIYINTLGSLSPTINECVNAALKEVSDKLNLLLEVKQITKQFAINLSNIADASVPGSLKVILKSYLPPHSSIKY